MVAHLRLYDNARQAITRSKKRAGRARACACPSDFFHPCETFRRYDIFVAYNNIIGRIPALLRIAGFVYRRDKKYGKSGGYKKFSGSKNFYSFSTHPFGSCLLPSLPLSPPRFAFSFSPSHLRSPMAIAITGGNISLLWWISVFPALVYQDIASAVGN